MREGEVGVGQGVADGDGEERLLYDEEGGEVRRGEEEWQESGVRREVGRCRRQVWGGESAGGRIDEGEEEDGGKKSDGQDEEEDEDAEEERVEGERRSCGVPTDGGGGGAGGRGSHSINFGGKEGERGEEKEG